MLRFLSVRIGNLKLTKACRLQKWPLPGHSNLGSDGRYFCSGVPPMVSWWMHYLAKGPRPDFNNGPGDNSNSGSILATGVYSSPIRIMGLSPSHSYLGTLKITTAYTIAALLISLFFPPKCYEASFCELKVSTKIV